MTEFSDYARLSLGSPDRRRVDEVVNWLIDRDSTLLLLTGEKRDARRQKLQEMFSSPEGLHILRHDAKAATARRAVTSPGGARVR